MIASRSVSIWTSNEKSHRNVFSVAFSLSVCRLRKGVCGTGGLVRLNRAGGSSCPGGKFFAEPQRSVAVCGRQKIRRTHGGGQEGRHLRFLTPNFEAFSISAILRILKLINASKTHFSINNSKSYYKMRKTLFFWFVQFHTVLEVYEPQTLV